MTGGTPQAWQGLRLDGRIGATLQVFRPDRRRIALHILHGIHKEAGDEAGITSLSLLADHVTAVENDCDLADIDQKTRKSVENSLRQNHLPTLNRIRIVDWDKRSGSIRTDERINQWALLLIGIEEAIRTSEIPDLSRARWSDDEV